MTKDITHWFLKRGWKDKRWQLLCRECCLQTPLGPPVVSAWWEKKNLSISHKQNTSVSFLFPLECNEITVLEQHCCWQSETILLIWDFMAAVQYQHSKESICIQHIHSISSKQLLFFLHLNYFSNGTW